MFASLLDHHSSILTIVNIPCCVIFIKVIQKINYEKYYFEFPTSIFLS